MVSIKCTNRWAGAGFDEEKGKLVVAPVNDTYT